MKTKSLLVVSAALAVTAAQANVNVDLYSGYNTNTDGSAFSGKVGSFNAPTINFATDTGYAWHPMGLSQFGAQITGEFHAPTLGMYTFALNSDDGSSFTIDNTLAVDNGGGHPPTYVEGQSVYLAAGCHPFKLNFYEDFGGESGVDLLVKQGGQDFRLSNQRDFCSSVPGPSALLGFGLSAIGIRIKRRKK